MCVDRRLGQRGQSSRILPSPHCADRLRLIARLHDPAVIRKILANVGVGPSGRSPGPAPPEPGAAASRSDRTTSPWAEQQRVPLAASHAIDRPSVNQAQLLGFDRLTGN
jgi:hypothetical protein